MTDLTPKQEAFAQAYVETGNASEAYRRAYDAAKTKLETVNVEACRLLSSPKIALRIKEIQAALAAKHEITLDKLTEMSFEAFEVGRAKGEAAGMVAAVKQLSRMHGFDTEKRENARDPLTDIPADVRRALLATIGSAREAARGDPGQASVH